MNNRDVQRLLRADADRFHAELSEIDLEVFRSQVFDRLGLNQDPEDPTGGPVRPQERRSASPEASNQADWMPRTPEGPTEA